MYSWWNTHRSHSFIKICIFAPFTKLSVLPPLLAVALLRRGGGWLKMWLDTFLGAVFPYFYFIFFHFFFPRPCFSCIFVKYTLQKRGEGWFCLWSLHSPDTLLLTHQCRCSRLLKFVLCMKDGNYAKPLLGQRTTVKSLKDEREHFGLWKQGCKFWQSLKM